MKIIKSMFFFNLIFCSYFCCIIAADSLKNIKMLMIVYRFPSISEGFVLNQIKAVLDEGIELDIVAAYANQTDIKQKIVTDYHLMSKVHYINFNDSSKHNILKDLFGSKQYDVIYCQYEGIALSIAPLICKLKNKPLFIAAVQGGEIDEKFANRADEYKYCFKQVDYFLPVCHFYKNKLIEFGCSPKKVIVQHTAIDIKFFPFKEKKISKEKPIHVITVARLNPSKGIDYGIKAVVKVHEQYPSITYTIIGGGFYESELKKIIKHYNAENYIQLVGWKTREEIAEIHKEKGSILLLPSIRSEGVPNALMEAMSCGVPVISTDHNGIPELVKHGQRGLLADIGNADQLAKHIIYIIEHPDAVEQLAKAAREYVVREHSTKFQNKKLVALLLKMIKKYKLKKDLDKI